MVADINNPKLENWKELIPEMESVLSSAEVIGGKLFLTYDKDASNHAYVYSQKGEHMHEIKLPSLGSVGFSGTKDDKECFFVFTSFTTPGTIYKYDLNDAAKQSYIDKFLERNQNCTDFAVGIQKALNGEDTENYGWFLS